MLEKNYSLIYSKIKMTKLQTITVYFTLKQIPKS